VAGICPVCGPIAANSPEEVELHNAGITHLYLSHIRSVYFEATHYRQRSD
jgi:hypothetical protein